MNRCVGPGASIQESFPGGVTKDVHFSPVLNSDSYKISAKEVY